MGGSFAGSKGLQRLEKVRAGKSPEEIAAEEGITVETVEQSIREHKVRQILDARMLLERQNNRLRRRIQQNLGTDYENALKKLLEGKKEIAILVDGEIIPVTVQDPKALAFGLQEYRRSVAMEEKPAVPAVPTTIINVQQNNNGQYGEDFETRLERLRRLRQEQEERVVDVEAETAIETESSEDRLERIRRLREGLAQEAGTIDRNEPLPGQHLKADKWDF